MGTPIGLDFGAVMTMGAALGADPEMLASVLPRVERAMIDAISEGGDDG